MKRPFVAGPVWPPLTRLAPAPALPLRPCCVKGALPRGAAEEEPVVEAARARLRTGARRPMACATAPRSRQKARGPRDRWAGLAARGSSLGSLQVAGSLGRAPRQRWLPSGIASANLLRRGWNAGGGAAAREPLQPPSRQGAVPR